jgi:osmotically-inducible protein OsmY
VACTKSTTSFRCACSTTTAATDAEIRGAALQRLIWDPEIPGGYMDVGVKDGWVTLKGDVDYQYQSDIAFNHVASLYGVTGVTNDIKVVERL